MIIWTRKTSMHLIRHLTESRIPDADVSSRDLKLRMPGTKKVYFRHPYLLFALMLLIRRKEKQGHIFHYCRFARLTFQNKADTI